MTEFHFRVIIYVLLILIMAVHPAFAQMDVIENLVETDDEFSVNQDVLDELFTLIDNPINVNNADVQTLLRLPWLTEELAESIITYRHEFGPFHDIADLQNIPSIDSSLYEKLVPFITVEADRAPRQYLLTTRTRFLQKFEKPIGFQNGKYENSPVAFYQRTEAKYSEHWTVGLTSEKDSGELKFNDFFASHLLYRGENSANQFIVGNYRLEAGQGLVLWGPYGLGKGSDPASFVHKQERGIRPYTMVDENASLYGAAVQKCVNIYQILMFYSQQFLDANPDSMAVTKNLHVSGYHRTESEKSAKDVLSEKLFGARLLINLNRGLKIGATAYQSIYSQSIGSSDYERQYYSFRGHRNNVGAIDFTWSYRNLNLFGELAQSRSHGWGMICGSVVQSTPVAISLVFRHYGKDFHSLHGVGFGAFTGSPQNEQGICLGINYRVTRRFRLSGYYDTFQTLWRTYLVPMPNDGKDMMLQLSARVNSKITLSIMGKQKWNWNNGEVINQYGLDWPTLSPAILRTWRYQMDFQASKKLRLRCRLEHKMHELSTTNKGLLLYQDVRYQYNDLISIDARLSFFDTDDYESRVYQFENDVPYVLTNKMLYGKGSRWYCCLYIKPVSFARISFKYESTNYEFVDANSIGSGNDAIAGNSFHQIRFQIETYLQ
ncbi:helix-hairpin-helix domain-containing protein [candidate division KSB1 bacterium]|nr:helix-hairpin-helix domain-containing protein [candidate division KSB1 bacterium]